MKCLPSLVPPKVSIPTIAFSTDGAHVGSLTSVNCLMIFPLRSVRKLPITVPACIPSGYINVTCINHDATFILCSYLLLSPAWILSWAVKLHLAANLLLQMEHWNGRSFVWVRSWSTAWLRAGNTFGQKQHLIKAPEVTFATTSSPCTLISCEASFVASAKVSSHCPHLWGLLCVFSWLIRWVRNLKVFWQTEHWWWFGAVELFSLPLNTAAVLCFDLMCRRRLDLSGELGMFQMC